jgi:hypothetical protein
MIKLLGPGENPRKTLRKHRERGPKRFEYTYEKLANLRGIKEQSLRLHVTKGELDPSDLLSVSCYLMKAVVGPQEALADESALEAINEDPALKLEAWQSRYPLFEIFQCAFRDCPNPIVGPGLCRNHGHVRRALELDRQNYLMVLVGVDYVPFHRLVMGEPANLHVHHQDRNKWNNRPSNLEALTGIEHFLEHRGLGDRRLNKAALCATPGQLVSVHCLSNKNEKD